MSYNSWFPDLINDLITLGYRSEYKNNDFITVISTTNITTRVDQLILWAYYQHQISRAYDWQRMTGQTVTRPARTNSAKRWATEQSADGKTELTNEFD